MPTLGWSALICSAMVSPSSVKLGGIRVSRMATSGGSRRMHASSSGPLAAWALTSTRAARSRAASPARNSAESSARATRTGSSRLAVSLSRRACHCELSAERGYAVRERGQTGARSVGPALPIVVDLNDQHLFLLADADIGD